MAPRPHHIREAIYRKTTRAVFLTLCTARKTRLFSDDAAATQVVQTIARLHRPDQKIFVYCVMPDHVHLVVLLRNRTPGEFVQPMKSIVTRAIGGQTNSHRVWQRDYYDRVIRRSDGLFRTIRYVLMNPVRNGFVKRWQDWPWSGSIEWPDLDDGVLDQSNTEYVFWQ